MADRLATATSIVQTLLSEAQAFRSAYLFGSPSGVVAVFDEEAELIVVGDVQCGIIQMPTTDARARRWASLPAAKVKALISGHHLYETTGQLVGFAHRAALIVSDWLLQRGLQIQGAVRVDGLGYVAAQLRNDTKFECQLIDMALSAAGFIRRDWPAGYVEGRKYAFAGPGWVTYVKADEVDESLGQNDIS